MSSPARVTANGWGWRYAGRRLPAVRDVSFTIEPGERVLLLGAAGAGKSTLLAGLAGVLGDADEGERTGTLHIDGAAPESRRRGATPGRRRARARGHPRRGHRRHGRRGRSGRRGRRGRRVRVGER